MSCSINEKLPLECQNIEEVRHEIDNIDHEIIRLLSSRLGYVREVVKYKDSSHDAIEAPERRAYVMHSRREWAEAAGISPDVIEDIYNRLVGFYIEEEKRIAQPKS